MAIERPNQVWCADIAYIPVQCGFLSLVAIIDWATRHVSYVQNLLQIAFTMLPSGLPGMVGA